MHSYRDELSTFSIDELTKEIAERSHYLTTEVFRAPLQKSASVLAAVFPSETARELNLQEQAWQRYAGALATTITGGNDWKNLQVVTVPTEIRWDDPEFGPYYFHKHAADLIGETGGTYRKSAKSFSEVYRDFLNDVQGPVVDDEALKESRAALDDAMAAQDQHDTLELNIALEWQAFDNRQTSSLPPSRWIAMEDWYVRRRKNAALTASLRIVLAHWAKFNKLIEAAFGGGETITRMVDAFNNARLLEVTLPRTDSQRPGGKKMIYPYEISVDYPTWLRDAKAGRHTRLAFSMTHNTFSYDYSATSIGGGIGIGFGFFGIIAGGRRQTVQIDTSSSSFRLDFEADLQTFDITPSDWYSSTAFELFADGPFVPGSPIERKHRMGTLFGPNGLVSFRPARAIVAYKPVVRVKLSKSEYHYFRQVTSGASVFYVGPFAIGGGSYYDVKESVRWDDQNFELNLFNAPETPVLLAFDSDDLP